VDARSDIFSFGAVLYEMVTGQRAFHGDSRMSTLAAVMNQEPKAVSESVPAVPRELERLIARCLRKDVARRAQHMPDLKLALEELAQDSESGTLTGPPTAGTKTRKWHIAGAVALAVAVVAAVLVWHRSAAPGKQVTFNPVPLTSYEGEETMPEFSPDGSQVAFSWSRGKSRDLFVKVVGTEPPLKLAEGVYPAWSPDGRIIAYQSVGERPAIRLISPLGGVGKAVAEFDGNGHMSWSPDSKWIAAATGGKDAAGIHLIPVEPGEQRRLTRAPMDRDPAFSPDGRTIAFLRCETALLCNVYLLDLTPELQPKAEPRGLTKQRAIMSRPVWTVDGQELVYTFGAYAFADGTGIGSLYRVPVNGSAEPRRLDFAGQGVYTPALSRRGGSPGIQPQHGASTPMGVGEG
jgi:hypothetical protein